MGSFLDGLTTVGKAIGQIEANRIKNRYGMGDQDQQQPGQQQPGIMPALLRNIRRYGVQQNTQATPTNPLGLGTVDREVAAPDGDMGPDDSGVNLNEQQQMLPPPRNKRRFGMPPGGMGGDDAAAGVGDLAEFF